MSVSFTIFGLSLLFQGHRWASTPAYHVLLEVFRSETWGALFLASGISMGAAVWQSGRRPLVIASLILGFALTTGWMLAFIVRYFTSPDTTPETWVSWAVFNYQLLRVALDISPAGQRALREPAAARDYREAVDQALVTAGRAERERVLAALDTSLADARGAAGDAYAAHSQALATASRSTDDSALLAITQARDALQRAEEAYARTQPAPPQ